LRATWKTFLRGYLRCGILSFGFARALARIFMSEVDRLVREAAGVAPTSDRAANELPRIGAVTFLPARPTTPGDLDTLTARMRKRLIRWFRRAGLFDAEAATDMLAWEHSGCSIDALRSDLLFMPQSACLLQAPRASRAILRSARVRPRTAHGHRWPRRRRGAHPLHAPAAPARAVDRAWPQQEEDDDF